MSTIRFTCRCHTLSDSKYRATDGHLPNITGRSIRRCNSLLHKHLGGITPPRAPDCPTGRFDRACPLRKWQESMAGLRPEPKPVLAPRRQDRQGKPDDRRRAGGGKPDQTAANGVTSCLSPITCHLLLARGPRAPPPGWKRRFRGRASRAFPFSGRVGFGPVGSVRAQDLQGGPAWAEILAEPPTSGRGTGGRGLE